MLLPAESKRTIATWESCSSSTWFIEEVAIEKVGSESEAGSQGIMCGAALAWC